MRLDRTEDNRTEQLSSPCKYWHSGVRQHCCRCSVRRSPNCDLSQLLLTDARGETQATRMPSLQGRWIYLHRQGPTAGMYGAGDGQSKEKTCGFHLFGSIFSSIIWKNYHILEVYNYYFCSVMVHYNYSVSDVWPKYSNIREVYSWNFNPVIEIQSLPWLKCINSIVRLH